jgi:hypothetical protein
MNRTATIILCGCLAVSFLPSPASAYLDPGSGSMLLQALLGGAAGIAVLIKLYWRRLRAGLGVDEKAGGQDSDEARPDTASTLDTDKNRHGK